MMALLNVLKARYPAWMALSGVGSLQLSYIVIHILFSVASNTFDAYGKDLVVYWYSSLLALLEGW